MAGRSALLSAVAVGLASIVTATDPPTSLMLNAFNKTLYVEMTDGADDTGVLSWSSRRQFLFEDDVKVNAVMRPAGINNYELDLLASNVDKVVRCNAEATIYDQVTNKCTVLAGRKTNTAVKEFVTGNSYFFCMIMVDDKVRCWGYNGGYGMLGFGDGTYRYVPTNNPITYNIGLQTRRRRKMLPFGYTYNTMGAVLNDGSVWLVGRGDHGELGAGHTSNRNYWQSQAHYLTNVTSIVNGGDSVSTLCAIQGNGMLYCWGHNNYGQVGVGHTSNMKQPGKVLAIGKVRMVAINRENSATTCAVEETGSVWCWGYNGYGQVGVGSTSNYDSPQKVKLDGNNNFLADIDYVAMHGNSACTVFAVARDGTLWAWGYSSHGQTGTKTTSHRKYPSKVMHNAAPLTDVVDVFPCNGGRYGPIFALMKDGGVWSWGYNSRGALGQGDTTQRNEAQRMILLTGAVDHIENPPMIDHSYAYHTACAIMKVTREVYCWGYNNRGQIGDGTTSQRNNPTKVRNIGRTSIMGSRTYHASNGDTTFYAASEDGYTVWAWGYSGHGQVGAHTWTITANDISQKVRLE